VASKSDHDARIHDAVRLYHYKLQEVGDHLAPNYYTVSAITKRQATGSRKQSSDNKYSTSSAQLQQKQGFVQKVAVQIPSNNTCRWVKTVLISYSKYENTNWRRRSHETLLHFRRQLLFVGPRQM
jgi:hypothetical protein